MVAGKPDEHQVLIGQHTVDGHRVLTITGLLDGASYRTIRDTIVGAALDDPRSVIVDIDGLQAPADSAWSVLTSAGWLISDWPAVPLVLACANGARRRLLARNGITKHLRVYAGVGVATAGEMPRPVRNHARLRLPGSCASARSARKFVALWLRRWGREEMIAAASVVVTELVENVLKHTDSAPRVLLETDGVVITIAVQDDSSALAVLPETGPALTGLGIVNAVSKMWRNAPTPGGKVVWAMLGAENRI